MFSHAPHARSRTSTTSTGKRRYSPRPLALAAAIASISLSGGAALAAPGLIAVGTLTGSSDLSGLTGKLESGVSANVLGGLGSGLAWAGASTFLALPDRGPNATAYDGGASVDNTTTYISRFHSVTMTLTPSSSGLPFTVTPQLNGTTLLSSSSALVYASGGAPSSNSVGTYFFSGRSDNFGGLNSGSLSSGRFDPEGIRVSADGRSVFVSDEYGPYVRQFDRQTGSLIKSFVLPDKYYISNQNSVGQTEIDNNKALGRVANKGMEGLAITPDGKTLIGIVQAPMAQDAAISASNKLLRIIAIDVATGAIRGEYGYKLTNGSGVSEITAINDHEFLVLERDGKGLGDASTAVAKTLYKIDLAGATDISTKTGADAANAAVTKSEFVNLVALLGVNGVSATNVPSKLEGLAFGQDVNLNGVLTHTLWLSNDNDFLTDSAGPNLFYVFGVTDADLKGSIFVGQTLDTPNSMALGLLGLGLIGWLGRRTRTAA